MGIGVTPPAVLVYITRMWPPAVGGMETYSVELTSELARHRPVEIFTLPAPLSVTTNIFDTGKRRWRP